MKTLQPLEHDYLIGCGGGFSSPVVGQTVADLTGLKVRIFDNWREATVYGGYVLCCRATGKPVPRAARSRKFAPSRRRRWSATTKIGRKCASISRSLN